MIDVSALMPVLYLGMSVGSMLWEARARRRRVWWINVATAHFGPASPVGEGARRWSGTLDGTTWTLVDQTGVLLRVAAQIGWRAGPARKGRGPLDGPVGDADFDLHVALYDDVGCAAAVLPREARATVAEWVRAGGHIEGSAVEVVVPWKTMAPEDFPAWLQAQVAAVQALTLPEDRHAALVARLSDPDLATRVFAAASLGAQLPDVHRAAAVADAWSSLEAPEPPRHAVDLLNRFTSRGDGPTRRLLALLAAPQPGATEEVVRALSTLGTADAIMPLLDLRRVPITDRRLVPAVDAALKAIRGTLQGVDGGRLAVVEGDPARGALSVVDDAPEV